MITGPLSEAMLLLREVITDKRCVHVETLTRAHEILGAIWQREAAKILKRKPVDFAKEARELADEVTRGEGEKSIEALARRMYEKGLAAGGSFSTGELGLVRQWFNAVDDATPGFLGVRDRDLARKIETILS